MDHNNIDASLACSVWDEDTAVFFGSEEFIFDPKSCVVSLANLSTIVDDCGDVTSRSGLVY